MRFALINPHWEFDGSIYFGCREKHLPLEYGYSKLLLEGAGHEAVLIDGHMGELSDAQIVDRVAQFKPDVLVITTAPTYLFWRCAPPELRIPQRLCSLLRPHARQLVAVGPHASTTPRATLNKLGVDVGRSGRMRRDTSHAGRRSLRSALDCLPGRGEGNCSRAESSG